MNTGWISACTGKTGKFITPLSTLVQSLTNTAACRDETNRSLEPLIFNCSHHLQPHEMILCNSCMCLWFKCFFFFTCLNTNQNAITVKWLALYRLLWCFPFLAEALPIILTHLLYIDCCNLVLGTQTNIDFISQQKSYILYDFQIHWTSVKFFHTVQHQVIKITY